MARHRLISHLSLLDCTNMAAYGFNYFCDLHTKVLTTHGKTHAKLQRSTALISGLNSVM